jgi:glycosyltransferase involved in cell wall biosynthesis
MPAIIPERYGRGTVRALVVSNMLPDAAHPERGSFVRDQVDALRGLAGPDGGPHGELEVELYEFPPGGRALAQATVDLHRAYGRLRLRGPRFDVLHAHFGLTAWPSLAVPARVRALTVHGTDVRHPRTRQATRAVLPLLAAVSAPLAAELPGRAARRRALVLPCGVDLDRFKPLPRAQARVELGLHPHRPYLLFAADPTRPDKRHDRALELARAVDVELLVLGAVDPSRVPLWINAANAVLVPSEHEGFGLAVLEALACDVPVLATPVGIHPEALLNVAGTLCAPFELPRWRAALEPHLRASDPRVHGRSSAEPFSARAMALRVAGAWRAALARSG